MKWLSLTKFNLSSGSADCNKGAPAQKAQVPETGLNPAVEQADPTSF
jgi:hypothetical protein